MLNKEMPYAAIMAVTGKGKYRVLGGKEGTEGVGRPLWGRMAKLRPIDSGGYELHVGNPIGPILVFTLLLAQFVTPFFEKP